MGLNRLLPSIHQREIAQRHTQRRNALYAPRLLRGNYAAHGDLSAAGDDPTIHHDGLLQCRAETITLDVGIAGQAAHQAHGDERSRRNSECWRHDNAWNLGRRSWRQIILNLRAIRDGGILHRLARRSRVLLLCGQAGDRKHGHQHHQCQDGPARTDLHNHRGELALTHGETLLMNNTNSIDAYERVPAPSWP